MKNLQIRHCQPGDYDAVVQIYNHYVVHSHATFDVSTYTVGARAAWFAQFSETGPHQLLVARDGSAVLGYCCSTMFKRRAAYDVSVETSAYLAPDCLGRGIGRKLYANLLARLEVTDLHGAFAGVALPNEASLKMHKRLGFEQIGVFTEVGRKFDKYWDVAWLQKRIP